MPIFCIKRLDKTNSFFKFADVLFLFLNYEKSNVILKLDDVGDIVKL